MDNNTTTQERWTARVSDWRASGLTATKYCEGRDFSVAGLRHWSYLLKRRGVAIAGAAEPARRSVHLVRLKTTAAAPATATPATTLTVELGPARLAVPAGFDAATLRAVIEALTATSRGDGP